MGKLGPRAIAVGSMLFLCASGASSTSAETYEESHNAWLSDLRAAETSVIEAHLGTLERDDNVLVVVADNGTVATFEDEHCECFDERHFFAIEYLEPISSFLIKESGHELYRFHLLHKPTGQRVEVFAEPAVHAESRQFVVVNFDESEAGITGIQIGHEADEGLSIDAEAELRGYEFASWIAPDRVALRYTTWIDHYLTKAEQEERGFGDGISRVAELVRQGGVWHLVEIVSTPLLSSKVPDDAQ